jgi:hypothetical protein
LARQPVLRLPGRVVDAGGLRVLPGGERGRAVSHPPPARRGPRRPPRSRRPPWRATTVCA